MIAQGRFMILVLALMVARVAQARPCRAISIRSLPRYASVSRTGSSSTPRRRPSSFTTSALSDPARWLSLEINGRYHFDKTITPVWTDNQHILEVSPGLRIEVVPRLIFEGGAGIALTDATRAIYKVRVLAGLTYEFSLY